MRIHCADCDQPHDHRAPCLPKLPAAKRKPAPKAKAAEPAKPKRSGRKGG
jgi:hypothetical protein